MTTMTQQCSAVQPTPRHRAVRPQPLRRAARALAGLYADRPLVAAVRPDDGGRLPGRPYAELAVLPPR